MRLLQFIHIFYLLTTLAIIICYNLNVSHTFFAPFYLTWLTVFHCLFIFFFFCFVRVFYKNIYIFVVHSHANELHLLNSDHTVFTCLRIVFDRRIRPTFFYLTVESFVLPSLKGDQPDVWFNLFDTDRPFFSHTIVMQLMASSKAHLANRFVSIVTVARWNIISSVQTNEKSAKTMLKHEQK